MDGARISARVLGRFEIAPADDHSDEVAWRRVSAQRLSKLQLVAAGNPSLRGDAEGLIPHVRSRS